MAVTSGVCHNVHVAAYSFVRLPIILARGLLLGQRSSTRSESTRVIRVPTIQACQWVDRLPGEQAYARVLRVLLLGVVAAVLASPAVAFAASPHVAYDSGSAACDACHAPHQASSTRYLFNERATAGGARASQAALCYTCHDGSTAGNVKTGPYSFGSASGHTVEERGPGAAGADLTDTCSSCHYAHNDWTDDVRLPRPTINGRAVTGADTSWCLACHDDAQSWYTSTTTTPYPQLSSPVRAEDGYPATGTFPGATVYTDAVANPHASIPASIVPGVAVPSREATRVAGDCLYCHAAHGGVSERDGLLRPFGASSDSVVDREQGRYAELCFRCHAGADSELDFGVADIKSLVTHDADDPGHTIRTAGGTYAPGSPLPCYECHNPHGSAGGNTRLIADTVGEGLDPRTPADPENAGASADKVRRFCFACHTTYDTAPVGRPWGWDSEAGEYAAVGATDDVVGLARSAAVGANLLRLPSATGHNKDDLNSCYDCHGDIHRPMGGVSTGGVPCSVCHQALNGMAHNPPEYYGDTDTYHHVLTDPNWDQAPEDGPYPVYDPVTSPTLSCVSCHMDHGQYEALPDGIGKAYSLRSSALEAYPTPVNTDDGLCLSCHDYSLGARILRNEEGQKPNAMTSTTVMRVEENMWYGDATADPPVPPSPHNYTVPGDFNDGSTFYANCAKCHGTLGGTLSSGQFAVHFSPEQRLINALGDATVYEINEEEMCFRCHSYRADGLAGDIKPVDDKDWYGIADMSRASQAIYSQMEPSNNQFGHKPHDYKGLHLIASVDETQDYISNNKHVECADCHNHHVVGKVRHVYGTDNRVSGALKGVRGVGFKDGALATLAQDNWAIANPISYGTGASDELEYKQFATYEYEICFKCHSSANTRLAEWGGKMVWTDWSNPSSPGTGTNTSVNNWTNVAQDFNVGNNSRHPVFATLGGYYYPSAEADAMVQISGYADTVTRGTSSLEAYQVSNGWGQGDTMMCSDCHGDSSAPYAMVEDPPGSGVWVPNPAAVNVPQGPHGASIRYSLRGPGTDWPVRTDLATPRLITLNDLGNAAYASNIFCSNCHPAEKAIDNRAHSASRTGHGPRACINCHVLVPHGSKVSRLIGDYETMPARLAYQGNLNNMMMSSYQKGASTKNSCSVVAGSVCTGGSGHSVTGNRTGGNWENW